VHEDDGDGLGRHALEPPDAPDAGPGSAIARGNGRGRQQENGPMSGM
jgi:hypothetical protein